MVVPTERHDMRLARTETNIAYRTADYDRQQNLDVYRVDNVEINTDMVGGIVAKAGTTKQDLTRYADYKNGWSGVDGKSGNSTKGKVTTDPERLKQAQKSKQEMAKFVKEQNMCKVVAKNGHDVRHLDDTKQIDGSYDILIDGRKADLKKTKGSGNIIKYAEYAIRHQKADLIVYEFETKNEKIISKIHELQRKGYKFMYYYTGENILYDCT